MSFDLYFYKKNDNRLSEEEIAQSLTENVFATDGEFPRQWIYETAETNVYFTIERNEPDDDETDPACANFTNTNFSFSINYFRPNFFCAGNPSFINLSVL